MKSRKFVHVAHLLYSFGTGGMEKGIATVINHGSSEFRHSIICLKQSGASQNLLNNDIQFIEMNKKEGNSFFFIFRLVKAIKRLNPDIVHTRNWGGVDGVIAAKLAGVKVVVHGEHGWSMDDPYGLNRKRILIRRMMDWFIDSYTCVSLQMKNWLEKDIRVRKSVLQIYNGLDSCRFALCRNERLRCVLGIPSDSFAIGMVARLDPIKNHPVLIQAFNRIQERYPKTVLLIIGDGPERAKLENMGRKGILFLGSRADVPNLLGCLDLFVLSSFNEGISNTIMEAMAAGLPVIASNRGGNPELVRHGLNGYLFDPEDSSALENYIVRYIRAPEVRKMHGNRGRRDAEKLFPIETMVQNYEKAWRGAVKTGKYPS